MKYGRILTQFYGSVWAMMPERIAEVEAFLIAAAKGNIKADFGDAAPNDSSVSSVGDIAVIEISGMIIPRADMIQEACGGAISAERVSALLTEADETADTIVMRIDSPGGNVARVPEVAAQMREIRERKRLITLADTMAASAAYWWLSQGSEAYAAPSASVGHVGAYMAHTDRSKWEEINGFKTTLIASTPQKIEGSPYEPLTDAARERMTEMVRDAMNSFASDVADGRGVGVAEVLERYGQGRILTAREALDRGMIDGLKTFEQLISELTKPRERPAVDSARSRLRRVV